MHLSHHLINSTPHNSPGPLIMTPPPTQPHSSLSPFTQETHLTSSLNNTQQSPCPTSSSISIKKTPTQINHPPPSQTFHIPFSCKFENGLFIISPQWKTTHQRLLLQPFTSTYPLDSGTDQCGKLTTITDPLIHLEPSRSSLQPNPAAPSFEFTGAPTTPVGYSPKSPDDASWPPKWDCNEGSAASTSPGVFRVHDPTLQLHSLSLPKPNRDSKALPQRVSGSGSVRRSSGISISNLLPTHAKRRSSPATHVSRPKRQHTPAEQHPEWFEAPNVDTTSSPNAFD